MRPSFTVSSQCTKYVASGSFEGVVSAPRSFWRSSRVASASASLFRSNVRVTYVRFPLFGSDPMNTRTRQRVEPLANSTFRTLATIDASGSGGTTPTNGS